MSGVTVGGIELERKPGEVWDTRLHDSILSVEVATNQLWASLWIHGVNGPGEHGEMVTVDNLPVGTTAQQAADLLATTIRNSTDPRVVAWRSEHMPDATRGPLPNVQPAWAVLDRIATILGCQPGESYTDAARRVLERAEMWEVEARAMKTALDIGDGCDVQEECRRISEDARRCRIISRLHGPSQLDALIDVATELTEARRNYPPMNSMHEGWAVIREELDELWEEVRAKQGQRDMAAARKEAVQVAAMAVRFVIDCTEVDR